MKDCFFQLDQFPPIPQNYIDEALYSEYEYYGPPSYNVIRAETSFKYSKFANILYQKYNTDTKFNLAYYKFPAKTYYTWHTDRKRTCAINIVLNDALDSITLFREPVDQYISNIERVPYELGKMMLFNTTVEHSVVNVTDVDRIILTIGLIGPSFQDVKEFLNTINVTPDIYNQV